jgi:hypothetical protein
LIFFFNYNALFDDSRWKGVYDEQIEVCIQSLIAVHDSLPQDDIGRTLFHLTATSSELASALVFQKHQWLPSVSDLMQFSAYQRIPIIYHDSPFSNCLDGALESSIYSARCFPVNSTTRQEIDTLPASLLVASAYSLDLSLVSVHIDFLALFSVLTFSGFSCFGSNMVVEPAVRSESPRNTLGTSAQGQLWSELNALIDKLTRTVVPVESTSVLFSQESSDFILVVDRMAVSISAPDAIPRDFSVGVDPFQPNCVPSLCSYSSSFKCPLHAKNSENQAQSGILRSFGRFDCKYLRFRTTSDELARKLQLNCDYFSLESLSTIALQSTPFNKLCFASFVNCSVIQKLQPLPLQPTKWSLVYLDEQCIFQEDLHVRVDLNHAKWNLAGSILEQLQRDTFILAAQLKHLDSICSRQSVSHKSNLSTMRIDLQIEAPIFTIPFIWKESFHGELVPDVIFSGQQFELAIVSFNSIRVAQQYQMTACPLVDATSCNFLVSQHVPCVERYSNIPVLSTDVVVLGMSVQRSASPHDRCIFQDVDLKVVLHRPAVVLPKQAQEFFLSILIIFFSNHVVFICGF